MAGDTDIAAVARVLSAFHALVYRARTAPLEALLTASVMERYALDPWGGKTLTAGTGAPMSALLE